MVIGCNLTMFFFVIYFKRLHKDEKLNYERNLNGRAFQLYTYRSINFQPPILSQIQFNRSVFCICFLAMDLGLFYQIINGQHSRSKTKQDVGQVLVNGLHVNTFSAEKSVIIQHYQSTDLFGIHRNRNYYRENLYLDKVLCLRQTLPTQSKVFKVSYSLRIIRVV